MFDSLLAPHSLSKFTSIVMLWKCWSFRQFLVTWRKERGSSIGIKWDLNSPYTEQLQPDYYKHEITNHSDTFRSTTAKHPQNTPTIATIAGDLCKKRQGMPRNTSNCEFGAKPMRPGTLDSAVSFRWSSNFQSFYLVGVLLPFNHFFYEFPLFAQQIWKSM